MDMWDVVIVGAGPSGTSVAESLSARGLSVCLLDGGPDRRLGDEALPIDERKWAFQTVSDSCHWIRARGVGGASLAWGGWSFRFPDAVFRDGEWPYDSRTLAPYYERVERQLGVITGEVDARYAGAARALGLPVEPKRAARIGGRVWTALHLPAAQCARANTMALRLNHDGDRAHAVEVIDFAGKETSLRARAFVLAASPVETARVLLASDLAELSPRIGKGLVYHPTVGYMLIESRRGRSRHNRDPFPGSALIPRFVNLGEETRQDYVGGFTIEIEGPRAASDLVPNLRERIGMPLEAARDLNVTLVHGIGETLPHPERYVDLSPDVQDSLGRKVPRIRLAWSPSERRLVEDMKAACVATADALAPSGADLVQYFDPFETPVYLFHEAGTCAMGRTADAPCDPHGRLRALANVWIADASAMPSAGDRHPTLTILAHATRAAESIGSELH